MDKDKKINPDKKLNTDENLSTGVKGSTDNNFAIDKKTKKISLVLMMSFFAVIGLVLLILPKKDFSENENRSLAEFPSVSVNSIVSGQVTSGINTYLEDHFPARDFWISVKTEAELASGRREMNGIFIGRDGYLFGHYEEPKNNDRIIKAYSGLYQNISDYNKDIDVRLMLIPTSAVVYSDKLPFGAMMADQMETRQQIINESGMDFIECLDILNEHKNESQLYYKTDHHWTTMGAYYGYVAYCEAKGLVAADINEFTAETVTNDFHGTYSSKVNMPFEKGDSMTVYYDKTAKLTVNYEDGKELTDTLYNMDYLEVKDKYSMFLNNLHTNITIENANADSDRVLLLVKDSYANSMVPFLIHNYKTIYVLDTRYYKFGPVSFVKNHEDITDVLVLYNMGTLDGDTGIRGIF